ncbi:hypothetical protein BgiBS90_015722 [Biomphalaria glabrata]|nr:hypothetical protein BgiBS90_015722 [Biomphalaria glabrata]
MPFRVSFITLYIGHSEDLLKAQYNRSRHNEVKRHRDTCKTTGATIKSLTIDPSVNELLKLVDHCKHLYI